MPAGPRTLLYAMGGGLGHLSRMRAALASVPALSTSRGEASRTWLMSASPHLEAVAAMLPATPLCPPRAMNGQREQFRLWLMAFLDEARIERIVIDAFFAGILGELSADMIKSDVEVIHLARRLRLDRYEARLSQRPPLPLSLSVRVEPLSDDHEARLRTLSAAVTTMTLVDPPSAPTGLERALVADGPFTLVVHSGDADEQATLRARARATIAAGCAPERVVEAFANAGPFLYPASLLWREAGCVVSGAGFNAVRQGLALADVHVIVPFSRALDDQAWRASYRASLIAPTTTTAALATATATPT